MYLPYYSIHPSLYQITSYTHSCTQFHYTQPCTRPCTNPFIRSCIHAFYQSQARANLSNVDALFNDKLPMKFTRNYKKVHG